MTLHELKEAIRNEIEWFETTEGDDLECIGIENLEGILSKYFNKEIKLTEDGEF
jgi:hypothetical protein